jgi:hypothetical protein
MLTPRGCAGAVALLAVFMSSCWREQGPQRVVVSGTVTYQGKPIADGRIRFVPTKGTTGPVCIARIVDGAYRADARGGVPVATQQVQIFAYRHGAADPRGNETKPVGVFTSQGDQYLPSKYNEHSNMELLVEPAQGEIRKDFQLAE